jgi:hypothetical protein
VRLWSLASQGNSTHTACSFHGLHLRHVDKTRPSISGPAMTMCSGVVTEFLKKSSGLLRSRTAIGQSPLWFTLVDWRIDRQESTF